MEILDISNVVLMQSVRKSNDEARKEVSDFVSKSDESANHSSDNMESLLFNEEDEEDLIGPGSLQIVDSDLDEISPMRKKKGNPETIEVNGESRSHTNATNDEENSSGMKIHNILPDNINEENTLLGKLGSPNLDKEGSPYELRRYDPISEISSNKLGVHIHKGVPASQDHVSIDQTSDTDDDFKSNNKMFMRKKINTLIDSDSETDAEVEKFSEINTTTNKEHDISCPTSRKITKFSTLIDSESDSNDGLLTREPEERKRLSSEENAGHSFKQNDTSKKKKLKKTKKVNKKTTGSRPQDRSDEESSSDQSSSVDSETELSLASDTEDQPASRTGGITGKPRSKKIQRASAIKAISEMQAIQSETQRLHRETGVSIPYHRPKRRTLKEFLTRRTIEKPRLDVEGAGKKPKMTAEELEIFAKHLEERAKEATEFFKSESEDEFQHLPANSADNVKSLEGTAAIADESSCLNNENVDQQTLPENTQISDQDILSNILEPTSQDIQQFQKSTSEPIPDPTLTSEHSQMEPESESTVSTSSTGRSLIDLKRYLIAQRNLPIAPTIKGDSNMLIDFETGDILPVKPTGVECLFQRLVKSNVNRSKPKEQFSMTSTETGRLDFNVATLKEPNKEKEPKPGAAYMILKDNLRSLISKKRKDGFQKRIEESKEEEEEEFKKCCGLNDGDDEGGSSGEAEESLDAIEDSGGNSETRKKEIVIDDEENEIEPPAEEDEASGTEEVDECHQGDVEDIPEDEDDTNESDSESSSDEEVATKELISKKHRIIKPFEDSDEEPADLMLSNPGGQLADNLGNEPLPSNPGGLYDEDEQQNDKEVEDELLGLCSGQFDEVQKQQSAISQIPETQPPQCDDYAELMDLCSGRFNNLTPVTQASVGDTTVRKKIFLSEDEDYEANPLIKKKLTKRRKKQRKLGFSDDEETDNEFDEENDIEVEEIELSPHNTEENEEENESENEENVPETYIEYDSDENEIVVQLTEKDHKKRAKEFLEKEAELSGSEWGSADEDERNIDKYEGELGDEDEFDRNELQQELEKIHLRKMLDDDIRQVKKIQDLLFEDEEQDGVGRQRRFRWQNMQTGFSLDNPASSTVEENDGEDSADDEEEMRWRKMRFEREQFLREKTKEEIHAEVSSTSLGRTLLATMETDYEANVSVRKEVMEAKEFKPRSFLIAQCDMKAVKGSFLNCDKETLARIAESTSKICAGEEDDSTNKAKKSGNFVFAPLSEEEQALRKRKAVEPTAFQTPKKLKPNTGKKSFLFDRLM